MLDSWSPIFRTSRALKFGDIFQKSVMDVFLIFSHAFKKLSSNIWFQINKIKPDQAQNKITNKAKAKDSKNVVPFTGFFNLNFSYIIKTSQDLIQICVYF